MCVCSYSTLTLFSLILQNVVSQNNPWKGLDGQITTDYDIKEEILFHGAVLDTYRSEKTLSFTSTVNGIFPE